MAAAASFALAATSADAKTCRDAAGKFTACTAPAAQAPAKGCRDAAGHFARCDAAPAPRAMGGATASAGGGLMDAIRRRAAPPAPAARTATAAGRPASATAPAGAPTARCKDGSLSYSQHRSGTCAGHGGVASWM
jgi:hypothetical protein